MTKLKNIFMKAKYLLLLFAIFLLTLSCVSAERGNFTELQDNIDKSNNTVELTKDYSQEPGEPSNTVRVSNITLNGNDHTISSGMGSFINVSGDVEFNDIVFRCSDMMIVGECNNLSINNCSFEYNQHGLYMNVTGNNIVISNSRFTYAPVLDWYDYCKITAKSTTIINTTFNHSKESHCRALDLTSDEFKIINSTFTNLSNECGAAIYSKKGRGSIVNSKFYNNTAKLGGAIYSDSSLEVIGCEFIGNSLEWEYYHGTDGLCAAALYLNADDNVIRDSKFISNEGYYEGGAIRVVGDNTLIGNCYFEDNAGNDGIIYWQGNDGAVQDSAFLNNNGIAIIWLGSDGKIGNSNFTESIVDEIIYNLIEWRGANGLISNSKFSNSKISSVTWTGAKGQIDNCEFEKNKYCSVLWYAKDGKLSNSRFTECDNCVEWQGDNGVIDNCMFEKNTEQVINMDGNNGKVLNCKFHNNNVFYDVFEANGKNCLVDKCEFISNKADQYGAIKWNIDNGKIQNSVFKYNTAKWGDAAIAIGYKYKSILKNNVHANNAPIEIDASYSIPGNIYYASGQAATFKFVEKSSLKPIKNVKVEIFITDDSPWGRYYTIKSDSKGIAKLKLSNLKMFNDLTMSVSVKVPSCKWEYSENDDVSKYRYFTSDYGEWDTGFKMKPGKCIIKAPKVTAKHHKSKYFKITVKNKFTKKAMKSFKLKLKIFTGKKSATYIVKTNKKGVAKFNTKTLAKGTHKVVIKSKSRNYYINAKSKIKVK